MTEADFLAGIVAQPDELDRWLVLADWFEDAEDPRAELARLRYQLHADPKHPERPQRQARQLSLHAAGLPPIVPTHTGPGGIDFALVLAGTFHMGSLAEEAQRSTDEKRHRVTLTQPYFLSVHPVTVGQFSAFVEATGYKTEGELRSGSFGYFANQWQYDLSITWRKPGFPQNDRHPVTCVSFTDARKLVEWLNEVEAGWTYALPTEAQWEYACRAGSDTAYWWGNNSSDFDAHVWSLSNANRRTQPVDTRKPNPWGLWHMSGLVQEWCADWYDHYTAKAVTDPTGPATGTTRATRGGSWGTGREYARSAARIAIDPTARYTYGGIRLVCRAVR